MFEILKLKIKGLMTSASNDPNRSRTITPKNVKQILNNALERKNKRATWSVYRNGTASAKLNKGKVEEVKLVNLLLLV